MAFHPIFSNLDPYTMNSTFCQFEDATILVVGILVVVVVVHLVLDCPVLVCEVPVFSQNTVWEEL
jgi:hypothetical protein